MKDSHSVKLQQPDPTKPSIVVTLKLDCTKADAKWDADAKAKVTPEQQLANWRRTILTQALNSLAIQIAKYTPKPTSVQLEMQAKAKADHESEVNAATLNDLVS